jgi:3-hydroxymyristoyl/3-hydroxydecanoyl-(acyl carrier protein) dehydratase
MAITVVNKTQSGSAAASTLTIPAASAGNKLVVFFAQTATTSPPKAKDTTSGETGWSVKEPKALGSASANSLFVAVKTAVGGETTLNPTVGTGGTMQGIACYELSGATSEIDVAVNRDNIASAATAASSTVTTGALGNNGVVPVGGLAPVAGQQIAWQVEATESFTVAELELHGTSEAWTGVTSVKLGIFADNAGAPGALLGQATFAGTPGTNTWIAVSGLSVPVVAGTKYWLGAVPIGGTARIAKTEGGTATVRKSKKFTYNELTETTEWEAAQASGPLGMFANGERANGDVLLAALVGVANSFGEIKPWTGTGPMTVLQAESSRIIAGHYIPGSTLSAVTFTANWTTARTTGMLVVAIKPEGATTGTMAGSAKAKFGTSAAPAAQAGVSGKAAARFSQSGSVKAEGRLAGVAQARFTTAATPAARAAIAATATTRFAASASMAASAAIAGTAKARFATAASLSGTAGLAGATHARFLTAALLVGESESPPGTMAGAAHCRFVCTGALRAQAAISGQSHVVFNASAAPAARARIAGEAAVRFAAQGALASSAGLGGQAAVRFSSHGALAAAARLAGKAQIITRTSATLAAQARLSAAAHARFLVSGSISGRGTIPSAVYVSVDSGTHPAASVQEGVPSIVSIESGRPIYAVVEETVG